MKKIISASCMVLCSIWILAIVFVNILHYKAGSNLQGPELQQGVICQLNYLGHELRYNKLGERMQQLYPEGYVFINALYGLTWCEIAKCNPLDISLCERARIESRFAWAQVHSALAKRNFETNLQPKYGIFYRGWDNYLLGRILLTSKGKEDSLMEYYAANCAEIANAFTSTESPYPASYSQSYWPADACVAIASLKLHAELIDLRYESLISRWCQRVRAHPDMYTGLIPHATNSDGTGTESARGSSVALMLIFLSDIDTGWARDLLLKFKRHFMVDLFGIPFIREFPNGQQVKEDIDSGPIYLGVSLPGTIVAVGALHKLGDAESATRLSVNIEMAGLPQLKNNSKKFMSGEYAIADAFIAWTRMMKMHGKQGQAEVSHVVSWKFRLCSFIFISIFFAIILLLLRTLK